MFPLCKGGTHNGGSGQKLNQRLLEYEAEHLGDFFVTVLYLPKLPKTGSFFSEVQLH